MTQITKTSHIYIAGHTGLVGSAIYTKYLNLGYSNLITLSKSKLNLVDQEKTKKFFEEERPEYVILAAARVGGINANISFPTEFLYENLMIQNNIIFSAYQTGVKKLLFIGCGCAYPRQTPQPMKEKYLLTGLPESTNEGFTVAKIAGIKLCEKINLQYKRNFISCIPTNTYGPNDHYEDNRSHVIPALIKKFHQAKKTNLQKVIIWGTGNATREFVFVDDLANAIYFLMNNYHKSEVINIGGNQTVSIANLVTIIKEVTHYEGELFFDTSKPDGMPHRSLDSSNLKNLGFNSFKTDLQTGILKTYEDFLRKHG